VKKYDRLQSSCKTGKIRWYGRRGQRLSTWGKVKGAEDWEKDSNKGVVSDTGRYGVIAGVELCHAAQRTCEKV